MVMSQSTAVGSIVTGAIMLLFAIATVVCGAITMKKLSLSGEIVASAGLWSVYYAVPGILSIAAGASKNGVVMGFALFFNIIAVILSCVASVFLILFTIALHKVVDFSACVQFGDRCTCPYDVLTWNVKCDDLDIIRIMMITMVAAYGILSITSFTASIYGCSGTCCAPVDSVIVTPGCPTGGNTIVLATNQSSMNSCYPAGYGNPQPPAYGNRHGVQNMAF